MILGQVVSCMREAKMKHGLLVIYAATLFMKIADFHLDISTFITRMPQPDCKGVSSKILRFSIRDSRYFEPCEFNTRHALLFYFPLDVWIYMYSFVLFSILLLCRTGSIHTTTSGIVRSRDQVHMAVIWTNSDEP